MMEVVATTGAIRRAVKCHHQQTNTQLSTGRVPFLLPNCVKALKGMHVHNPLHYYHDNVITETVPFNTAHFLVCGL